MPDGLSTPAREAAEATKKRIETAIDEGKHFLVEAGAGAGKTYSLIESLRYVISKQGRSFTRLSQRVACITYTKVARDQILSRTDRNPLIEAGTIHAFLWSVIQDFQPFLHAELSKLGNWEERLKEAGDISSKPIEYNLGYPKVDEHSVLLHHDDVIAFGTLLLAHAKFRLRLASKFPIIFIDEYQDTNSAFVEALKTHVLSNGNGPQIGLFGDHWQAIYDGVCGKIEHPSLVVISKNANFRSVPAIVECLNRCRKELPQEVDDPGGIGTVAVYHTNKWTGQRRTDNPWQGDLPAELSVACHQQLIARLKDEGWDFTPPKTATEPPTTKVLMLTHRALATQQGYSSLADVFSNNDAFVKKEDSYIKFFAEKVEPACVAFEAGHVGEMIEALGSRRPVIDKLSTKQAWNKTMGELVIIKKSGTIGEVIDFLVKQPLLELRVPDEITRREKERQREGENAGESLVRMVERWDSMKSRPYSELSRMIEFINDKTPFSTKHGVKGAEFENVLVIIGRGWNRYNFSQYLERAANPEAIPPDKLSSFERNRNLFYVACSRPKKRLALLFTQLLSGGALDTLSSWFGAKAIQALTVTS